MSFVYVYKRDSARDSGWGIRFLNCNYNPGHKIVAKCTISAKKTCFPSTRKVLDFDLNGQHMRKTEVSEGDWVLDCSPDHSTIRPKILSLKSQPSPKDLLLDERS